MTVYNIGVQVGMYALITLKVQGIKMKLIAT